MGVAELRAAFNDVAEVGGFTATKAELAYEPHEGVQWQRLTFRGIDSDGKPFVVRSERLKPETDVTEEAKAVATKLIAPAEGPAP